MHSQRHEAGTKSTRRARHCSSMQHNHPCRSPHLQRQQVGLHGSVVGAVGTSHGPTNQASVHNQLLGLAKKLACTECMRSWKWPACSIKGGAAACQLHSSAQPSSLLAGHAYPAEQVAACMASMHSQTPDSRRNHSVAAAPDALSSTLRCSTRHQARLGTLAQCSSAIMFPVQSCPHLQSCSPQPLLN